MKIKHEKKVVSDIWPSLCKWCKGKMDLSSIHYVAGNPYEMVVTIHRNIEPIQNFMQFRTILNDNGL